MTDADLRAFLALRRHLRIAHHIPGRVRLKVAASVFTELGSIDPSVVERILHAVNGITDVRINKAAGSAIVVYAVETVDPDSWQVLIHGEDADALRVIKGALNGRTPEDFAGIGLGCPDRPEKANASADGSPNPGGFRPISLLRDQVSFASLNKGDDPSIAQTPKPLHEKTTSDGSR